MKFGLLVGKFSVLSPPLNVYHSSIASLSNIVEKISPALSSVGVISDMSASLIQVHSDILSRKVTYFGSGEEIHKLKTQLQKRTAGKVSQVRTICPMNCLCSVIPETQVVEIDEEIQNKTVPYTAPEIALVDLSTTSPFKSVIAGNVRKQGQSSNMRSFQEDLDAIGDGDSQ